MNKKPVSERSDEKLEVMLQNIEKNSVMQIEQLMQLSHTVYKQSKYISESESKLLDELNRFHKSTPQRGMAVVFQKFFKDLVGQLNNYDDLLRDLNIEKEIQDNSWIKAIVILRSGFESILKDWGLEEIKISEGIDIFNPELHQAVESMEELDNTNVPEETIIKVYKRGWKLQNFIIQYPQVVVK
jgi:molecular chaperone GrpE (heat shock protein)